MNKNERDRPATEMSFKKRTNTLKNTSPNTKGFGKNQSKSSLIINESEKKLTLDSNRSDQNKFTKFRRPAT